MTYVFYKRDDDGAKKVASVIIDHGEISWSEGSDYLVDLLEGRPWTALDDQHFDPKNTDHYALLPILLKGSRLWVVAE